MAAEDRLSVNDRGRLERLPKPLNLKNSGRGEEKRKESVHDNASSDNNNRYMLFDSLWVQRGQDSLTPPLIIVV